MENLYRLNEYSGRLPNPKSFPVREAVISAIEGKPYAFTNGFIVDLSVREADKAILEGKVYRTIDIRSISAYLQAARESELLLSEPEFIYDITVPAYIVFTPEGNPVGIQVKYYKYFGNRYPKCRFYVKDEDSVSAPVPLVIKVDKEVVGLCMSMFYRKETLVEIKEERK